MRPRQINRPVELLLALAGLALLAAAVFAPIVSGGGFLADDWIFRALYLSEGGDGFGTALAALDDQPRLSHRPLQLAWQAMLQSVFGGNAGAALALTVGFAVVMCWALYAVLRELKVESLHAAVITVIVLVLPIADSTKLWIAAGYYSLSIALFLLGLLVGLIALRLENARSYLCHALSIALFAAAIATNEITVGAVATTGIFYLLVTDRRSALRRWAIDLSVIAVAALAFSGSRETTAITEWPDKAQVIVRQGAALFAERALPLGLSKEVLGLLVVALVGAAVAAWRHLDAGDSRRAPLRRWLGITGLGVVATIAGYLVLVPAAPGYTPAGQGIENRVNALAAIGMAVTAYGLVALTVLLATHAWKRRRFVAPVVAVAGALIAASNLSVLRDHQDLYVESAERREAVLAGIDRSIASPPPDDSVIFYVGPKEHISVSQGIPVFDHQYDLTGALQIKWSSYGLLAYPQGSEIEFACFPEFLSASGPALAKAGGGDTVGVLYSAPVFFYYSASGELRRVPDDEACRQAAPTLKASVDPGECRGSRTIGPRPRRASRS